MADTLQTFKVNDIKESKAALRQVDTTSEEFAQLVESIRTRGILNPVSVRFVKDEETGEQYPMLIDGLHRLTGAREAGLEEIPAQVKECASEKDALALQAIGNLHRIDTKPHEYAKQIQRMMAHDPLMTKKDVATLVNKSETWVDQRLGLNNLVEEIGKVVDEGKIKLANAYALSKLDEEEQPAWVEKAMTEAPGEFVPKCLDRKKEMDKAKREGRKTRAPEFKPTPRCQKMGDLKQEHEDHKVAKKLLKAHGVTKALDAFNLAIAWVLHLDPDNVAAAKAKWDEDQEKAKKKREEATAKRAEKKAENAKIRAEALELEVAVAKGEKDQAELDAFKQKHGLNKEDN